MIASRKLLFVLALTVAAVIVEVGAQSVTGDLVFTRSGTISPVSLYRRRLLGRDVTCTLRTYDALPPVKVGCLAGVIRRASCRRTTRRFPAKKGKPPHLWCI